MRLRRIDSELVRRGLAKSRSAAAQMIEDGRVKLDGQIVLKPARQMDPAQAIVVEETDDPEYVSRGAHKLAGALDALGDKAPPIEGRRARMPVHRREDLRTFCCDAVQLPLSRSMWDTASSPGSCNPIHVLRCAIALTCGPWIPIPLPPPPNLLWGTCRLFR